MLDTLEYLYAHCYRLDDLYSNGQCAKFGINVLGLTVFLLLLTLISIGVSGRASVEHKDTSERKQPDWVENAVASGEDFKMVFGIRQDLPMSKGKAAAQVAHAVLGVYEAALKVAPKAVAHWQKSGCAKVTLKVKDKEQLLQLYKTARSLKIPAYYVVDAGRTQIPENSETVLAIGPGPTSLINKVTGKLSLY